MERSRFRSLGAGRPPPPEGAPPKLQLAGVGYPLTGHFFGLDAPYWGLFSAQCRVSRCLETLVSQPLQRLASRKSPRDKAGRNSTSNLPPPTRCGRPSYDRMTANPPPPLTPEQIVPYLRDGILVVENLLTRQEVINAQRGLAKTLWDEYAVNVRDLEGTGCGLIRASSTNGAG